MRTVALIAVFVVLAGVFCGGKTGSQANKPAATAAKWPAEATARLTEDEMAQFIKVLPTFSAALKVGNWTPAQPNGVDNPVIYLTNLVEGMNVPGVDDSLKAFGGWAKLRPTLYKVFAAMSALQIDAAPPEAIAQLKKVTSAAAKRSLKGYETYKAACTQIPTANKQVLSNHQQELQGLQTLGR
jgi:hypothetical protein